MAEFSKKDICQNTTFRGIFVLSSLGANLGALYEGKKSSCLLSQVLEESPVLIGQGCI